MYKPSKELTLHVEQVSIKTLSWLLRFPWVIHHSAAWEFSSFNGFCLMWRWSGMESSGCGICYYWRRHGWNTLFMLQVLPATCTHPQNDTHTYTHPHIISTKSLTQTQWLLQPSSMRLQCVLTSSVSHLCLASLLFHQKTCSFSKLSFQKWG